MNKKLEQITWQVGSLSYQAIFKDNVFITFLIQNKKKTLLEFNTSESITQLQYVLSDLLFKLRLPEDL